MSQNNPQTLNDVRMPTLFVWGILAICAAPFLLNLAGIDFGSQKTPFPWSDASNMAPHQRIDAMFYTLAVEPKAIWSSTTISGTRLKRRPCEKRLGCSR